MTKLSKKVEDRSNSIRIQYNTEDKVPSSITIDPGLYSLLEAMHSDAKSILQNMAKEKRSELLRDAKVLAEKNELYKIEKGQRVEITPEEHIRGRISAAVRTEVIKQVARPELVAKVNFQV